jgi:hypothetical protein
MRIKYLIVEFNAILFRVSKIRWRFALQSCERRMRSANGILHTAALLLLEYLKNLFKTFVE